MTQQLVQGLTTGLETGQAYVLRKLLLGRGRSPPCTSREGRPLCTAGTECPPLSSLEMRYAKY
jgi:hypothetical protein